MLPPILPRPTMPSFIVRHLHAARRGGPGPPAARGRRGSAGRRRPAPASAWRSRSPHRGSARRRGRRRRPGRTRPWAGPPLWSWPVECRKRGPSPTVVATRSRSRRATRARVEVGDHADCRGRRRPGWRRSRPARTWSSRSARGVASTAGGVAAEHPRRGLLGRGHVRLVERVDAEQRPGTGRWPAPTAGPGRRRRRTRRPPAARPPGGRRRPGRRAPWSGSPSATKSRSSP